MHQWYNPNATPPLVEESHPAYCTIKVTANTTYVKSLPCSEDSNPDSLNVEKANKDAIYQAIGLYENIYGNLWYLVETKSGTTGYMYAGDTIYLAKRIYDIEQEGVTCPSEHLLGTSYVLTGKVKSDYNELTHVSVYIYEDSEEGEKVTGYKDTVIGNSYTLGGSKIDTKTVFGNLKEGEHTFVVTAYYENCYATSGKTYITDPDELVLFQRGFTVTEKLTNCTHSYTSKVTTAATCGKNGVRTYTCSICGDKYKETIPATGDHSYTDEVTTPANCGQNGVRTYTCTVCDSSYTQTIAAYGQHSFTYVVDVLFTCSTPGSITHTCTVCGLSFTTVQEPSGEHTYETTMHTAPTCTEEGYATYTCTVCGDSYSAAVPATNHPNTLHTNMKTATCDEDGYSGDIICIDCREVLSTGQSFPATGHSYKAVTTSPNCSYNGCTTYTCSKCGDSYTDDMVAALGHSYEAVVTAPTCTEDGFTTYTCSACGDSYTDDVVVALGHSYKAVVTAPTCYKDGYTTYTCSVCGDSYQKTTAQALGHTFVDGVCSVCGTHVYGQCGDDLTWTLSPDGLLMILGKGDMYDYNWDDMPWYDYLNDIKNVKVFSDATSVGQSAFYNCRQITDVYIGSTVTSIGYGAFLYCDSLSAFEVSTGNKYYCAVDGILYDKELTTLVQCPGGYTGTAEVPAGVTTIGEQAFDRCMGVTAIVMPDSVESIGFMSLSASDTLKTICFQGDAPAFGEDAFYGVTATAYYPAGNETWTSDVMKDYGGSITWKPAISCGKCGDDLIWLLEEDGTFILSGTGAMYDYELSTSWDNYTHQVTSVVLPEGLTAIGKLAFVDFSQITSITVPASVTAINEYAFLNCGSLSAFEVAEDNPNYCDVDGILYDKELTTLIQCPDIYTGAVEIPDGVNIISDMAFGGNGITTITVPASVKSIGCVSFSGLNTLAAICFEGDAPAMDDNAFFGVTITAYYPAGNITWTEDVLKNYGGTITWQALADCEHIDTQIKNAVDATCTETGYTGDTFCTACGTVVTAGQTIAALGHSYDAVITAPTCTEKGFTTYTCACGNTYTGDEVAATGHSYTISLTAPTCTEDGCTTRTCDLCGSSSQSPVAALGHSYETVVTAPTCAQEGYTTYTCTACEDIYIGDETAKLEHTYETELTDPTCTQEGYTTYTCTDCGDYYLDDGVDALGHSYETVVTAPTCTEAGFTTYTCTVCGDSYDGDEVAALGHSYETVVTAPTCTEAGCTTYTCSVCGDSYTETIPATGHLNTQLQNATTNSCTVDGYTGDTVCLDCGTTLETGTWIVATGHSYEAVVTAPTCTEAGCTTYTCSVCGDSYTADEVAALGHSYEAVVTAPTCTEAGFTTYTCACGDSYTADEVAALGHSYEAVVTAPTCTAAGYTTYTCACGDSYTADEVAALGHSYEAVVAAPTCTEAGFTTYTCACGDSYTADEVAATGHSYVSGVCACGDIEIKLSGTCGENVSFVLYGTGLLKISGTGPMSDYTSGQAPWYSKRYSIKKVEIDEGVTTIGEYAFTNYDNMTSISLPESLTSIGYFGIYACVNLTQVRVADLTSYLNLKMEAHGYPMDSGNKAKKLYVDGQLVTDLVIPEGVTKIPTNAFRYCTGLTSVTIPEGVTTIGTNAFQYCSKLTSVTVPDSVTKIESSAFASCTGLTELHLGSGLTTIGNDAFAACTSLGSVTIPASVSSVDGSAFGSCYSMTEIVVEEGNATYASVDGVLFNKNKTRLIRFPAGYSETVYTVPESVTVIGEAAFTSSKKLESVTLPDSVKTIENDAFESCLALAEVNLGSGLTSIGSEAFYSCAALTQIQLPENLTSIGQQAFRDTGLTSVTLPDSITTLDNAVFYGCDALTDVTLSNNLTEISISMFEECTALPTITIPDSVTTINRAAFNGCTGLTAITIPDSVTTIGESVFSGCKALADVSIGSGLTILESNTFNSCKALTEITIPDTVTTIKSSVFKDCTGLTRIVLSKNLTTLGNYAFWGCTALQQIVFRGDAPTMGSVSSPNIFYKVTATAYYPTGNDTWTSSVKQNYGGTITWAAKCMHNDTTVQNAVDATCTASGYTGDTVCNDCGETVTAGTVIEAKGHSYEAVVTAPTCTAAGYTTYTCTVCGDTYDGDEVAALGHSYEAVVTAPTCTAAGYTTYTCTACGDSYTADEVAALGHSYVDGTCTVCGEADPDYVAPIEKFDFAGVNMDLGNSLTMNFAVAASNISDGYYAEIVKTYADERGDVTYTIPMSDWELRGSTYVIAFKGIAAKEMADNITATIYNADGQAVSNPRSETIRAYAIRQLEKSTSSAELKTTLVDMLNYGAAAQVQFGYNTADLANSTLTAEQAALATAEVSAADNRVRGANYGGSQLILESQILMKIAFLGVTSDMSAQISYTDHNGNAHTIDVAYSEMEAINSTMTAVLIDELVIADARELVTVTVYNADGTVHGTGSDSVESYAARQIAKGESTLATLCETILKFGVSAYNYFH